MKRNLITGLATGLFLLGIAFSVKAASISGQGSWETTLLGRDLDGNLETFEAYYDKVLDITWLDPNYARTSGYDHDGKMTWDNAQTWVNNINPYGSGITGWRMPVNAPINGVTYNNNSTHDGSTDRGSSISAPGTIYAESTASEMAYMFYNTLGNSAQVNAFDPSGLTHNDPYGFVNTGPFASVTTVLGNVVPSPIFWSSTPYIDPDVPDLVYAFYTGTGAQSYSFKWQERRTWAVHDGDVGAAVVPVPPAIWLFGSGLIGLIGVARRKKS